MRCVLNDVFSVEIKILLQFTLLRYITIVEIVKKNLPGFRTNASSSPLRIVSDVTNTCSA